MLRYRAIQFTVNTTTRGVVAKGCPQGGVLSPLLWNIVVDDLLRRLNDQHHTTIGYADDITILISGKFENTLCNLMQSAMRIVEVWCTEHELSVNPNKTEMVLFTNKRKVSDMRPPTLFGATLQLSPEVKYLGITLDSKINWSNHIESKINKACITMWQCKRLLGKKWGLQPRIMLWLYKTIIRPTIAYGSVVWWPRTKLITAQNQLQRLQRMACVSVTGCMATTPTAALEILLDLPPLYLFIKQEAAASALRLKNSKLWTYDIRATHTRAMEEAIADQPLLTAPCDRIPKQHVFQKHFKIHFSEEKTDSSGTNELRIYTDGSKTNKGTGAGTYSADLNMTISSALSIHNTVFQAECVGITQAADALLARKVDNLKIRLLCDSTAVLSALDSNTIKSGLIMECHDKLEQISKTNDITLQWIKGHSGSLGNDAADELARRGSDMRVSAAEPLIPIPFTQMRTWLRDKTRQLHNKIWAATTDCRQSKEVLINLDRRLTTKLLRLNRIDLRIVVGTITGHINLNRHMHILGLTDSPLCRACMGADETPSHVVLECSEVGNHRAKTLGSPSTLREACSSPGSLVGFWKELGWLQ